MVIKPGISVSLYVSMVLGIAVFSGQNTTPSQESAPIAITADSAMEPLAGKWKLPEYLQDWCDESQTYRYTLEMPSQLLLYPVCREQSMSRDKSVSYTHLTLPTSDL